MRPGAVCIGPFPAIKRRNCHDVSKDAGVHPHPVLGSGGRRRDPAGRGNLLYAGGACVGVVLRQALGIPSAVCGADRHSAQPAAQGGVPHPPPLGDRPGVYHRGDGARRRDGLFLPQWTHAVCRVRAGHAGPVGARPRLYGSVRAGHSGGGLFAHVSGRAYAAGCGCVAAHGRGHGGGDAPSV